MPHASAYSNNDVSIRAVAGRAALRSHAMNNCSLIAGQSFVPWRQALCRTDLAALLPHVATHKSILLCLGRVCAELGNRSHQGAPALWPKEITEEGLLRSRPLLYSELGFILYAMISIAVHCISGELRGGTFGNRARGYGAAHSMPD
jgi:hypothetical protein